MLEPPTGPDLFECGMGTKDVAVRWSDIGRSRDGKSLVLTTNWTRESLKAMPEYKYERRQTQR